jgi:hypothetical protein
MLTGEAIQQGVSGALQNIAGKGDGTIEKRMESRIRYLAEHPGEIPHRLKEIDREWSEGRVLTAAAAGFIALGAALSATVERRLFILPAVVAGFMLEEAIVGKGPLSVAFRELGFRSSHEIAQEKYALKALRGDFNAARANGEGSAGWSSGGTGAAERAHLIMQAARA